MQTTVRTPILVVLLTALSLLASAAGPAVRAQGCDPTPCVEPPAGTPRLTLTSKTRLVWSVLDDARGYDVVYGSVRVLHATEGNFTEATEDCLANDLDGHLLEIDIRPFAAQGFWFLVRGVNEAGPGSYDVRLDSQVGSRDEEIAASPLACP